MDNKLTLVNLIENFKLDFLNFIYGIVSLFFINLHLQPNILEIRNNFLFNDNFIFYVVILAFAFLIGKLINFYSLILINIIIKIIKKVLREFRPTINNNEPLENSKKRFVEKLDLFLNKKIDIRIMPDQNTIYDAEFYLWVRKKNLEKKIRTITFDNSVIINLFGFSIFFLILTYHLVYLYILIISLCTLIYRFNHRTETERDMLNTMVKEKQGKQG